MLKRKGVRRKGGKWKNGKRKGIERTGGKEEGWTRKSEKLREEF